MTISKKQIIVLISLLILIFILPVAILLTQKRQDIRPKALQGKVNFLLSTDSINSSVGKNIDVLVSLQTTDSSLRVSGVDFLLLYDKDKLDVGNIVPNVILVDPKAPFTDAPIVTSGGSFDETYNFVRVAEIARRPTDQLPKGTFQLAKVTFRGRDTGQATIKFPDDNKYLEVVGTGTNIEPAVIVNDPAVNLSLEPTTNVFTVGGTKTYELKASFPHGGATKKVDYFKTEISFNPSYLQIPAGNYIDTSTSGFDKIFRVDGPTAANEAGKIIIELGAKTPGSGPATDKTITIAKINFSGKAAVSTSQNLTFGKTQIVNSQSNALTVNTAGTTYTVQ